MKNCKHCFNPIIDPWLSLQNNLKEIRGRNYLDKIFIDCCIICYQKALEIDSNSKNKYLESLARSLEKNLCIDTYYILIKKLNDLKSLVLIAPINKLEFWKITFLSYKNVEMSICLHGELLYLYKNTAELFVSAEPNDLVLFLLGYFAYEKLNQ